MDNNFIGEQIAKFRKAAGLTQEELGKAAGVSTQAVSRWECGGAPDVSLLPAIADRLGVTIDALFGREGGVREDIVEQTCRYIASQPVGKRLDTLCRMLFQVIQTIMPSGVFRKSVELPARCSFEDENGNNFLMRCGAKLEEGLIFGVGSEEFSFLTVTPEPTEGWAAYFAENGAYRKLFAVLARLNALEILDFLYSEKEHYIVPEAAAARLHLPLAEVEEIFAEMYGTHLLHRLEMEMASGMIYTYVINENLAFVPFMLAARCLIEKDMAFCIQWITRQTALLRLTEEKNKEKNKEETK